MLEVWVVLEEYVESLPLFPFTTSTLGKLVRDACRLDGKRLRLYLLLLI
jgi:hypothetical protein